MMWFFAILLVLVMGGIAVVAAGRGAPMSEAYDDRPDALVPATGDLGPDDLRRVRFSLAFRGYRMSEVDTLLDRLARQLETAASTAAETTAETTAERADETQLVVDEGGPAREADTRPDLRSRGDAGSQ